MKQLLPTSSLAQEIVRVFITVTMTGKEENKSKVEEKSFEAVKEKTKTRTPTNSSSYICYTYNERSTFLPLKWQAKKAILQVEGAKAKANQLLVSIFLFNQ
jgi:hypothetical protein